MSGSSIGFGEEIKKLCKKIYHLHMLIWSPGLMQNESNAESSLKKNLITLIQQ